MGKESKKRLANERRKWGAVVLLNVILFQFFPQKNGDLDIFPVESILRLVHPVKKIGTSITVVEIQEESENLGQ